MSLKSTIPAASKMMGRNIREGQTPGGMMSPVRQGPRPNNSSKYHAAYQEIVEAANVVLEKRGVWVRPTSMTDQVSQTVMERRKEASKENAT